MARANPQGAEFQSLRRVVAWASTALILCGPAFAQDPRAAQKLKLLDPSARFEQVCDLEAMKYIAKDKTYRPEHTIMSALETPRVIGLKMTGNGAAFRSKGKWYQFSFTCETDAEHLRVQAFTFKIGEPIPEEKWEASGLW